MVKTGQEFFIHDLPVGNVELRGMLAGNPALGMCYLLFLGDTCFRIFNNLGTLSVGIKEDPDEVFLDSSQTLHAPLQVTAKLEEGDGVRVWNLSSDSFSLLTIGQFGTGDRPCSVRVAPNFPGYKIFLRAELKRLVEALFQDRMEAVADGIWGHSPLDDLRKLELDLIDLVSGFVQ